MRIGIYVKAQILMVGLQRLLEEAGHHVIWMANEKTMIPRDQKLGTELTVTEYTDELLELVRGNEPVLGPPIMLILYNKINTAILRELIEDRGVMGILSVGANKDTLLTAVQNCRLENLFFDPLVGRDIIALIRHAGNGDAGKGPLTLREKQVLIMIAGGKTVRQIAGELNLSIKTVEVHKFNMMQKLDIHHKAGLVHYAIREELVTA